MKHYESFVIIITIIKFSSEVQYLMGLYMTSAVQDFG